jgi:hypothetical protein
MNFKNLLALCVLAVAAVKADDRTKSHKACVRKNGIFIEDVADPNNNNYGCLLPEEEGDKYWKYCVGYDGMNLCYTPEYGNMDVCVNWSDKFNSRGCAMGLWALYDAQKKNQEKLDSSKKTCYKTSGSIFIEAVGDENVDKRFACLTPQKSGDSGKYYCVGYDGKNLCYRPELGNITYCDLKSKDYHSRGCALGLGYLYDAVKLDLQKRQKSEKICKQKNGIMLKSDDNSSDRRFACLLPEQSGDNQVKYCVGFGGKNVCYDQQYGNMPYCDLKGDQFHSRGCALSLGYLYK